jgi:hypothetical protein
VVAAVANLVFFTSPISATESLPIKTALSTESADGYTQAELDIEMLSALEVRTKEIMQSKIKEAVSYYGNKNYKPNFTTTSTYMFAGKYKLAVINLEAVPYARARVIYGIKGRELLKILCMRNDGTSGNVPISYGPCADKIKSVFGVGFSS